MCFFQWFVSSFSWLANSLTTPELRATSLEAVNSKLELSENAIWLVRVYLKFDVLCNIYIWLLLRIHASSDTLRPPTPCVCIAPVPWILTAVKHAGIWQMNTRQCARISSVSDITAAAAVVWLIRYINLWPWYMCKTCAELPHFHSRDVL